MLQARDVIQPTFVTSQAAAARVALDQLPPLASGFTGREVELAQVAGLLDPAAGDAGAVVSAVAGLAGVGKTALAVQAAVSRDSARQLNDKGGEAIALNSLGIALRQVRRYEEAVSACRDAAAVFRETGDRHGEGSALNNLGLALAEVRRFAEAISACQDAVAIFRETADRHWEDIALDNLEKYRAAQAMSSDRQ